MIYNLLKLNQQKFSKVLCWLMVNYYIASLKLLPKKEYERNKMGLRLMVSILLVIGFPVVVKVQL
jgi:hypothetical protein